MEGNPDEPIIVTLDGKRSLKPCGLPPNRPSKPSLSYRTKETVYWLRNFLTGRDEPWTYDDIINREG